MVINFLKHTKITFEQMNELTVLCLPPKNGYESLLKDNTSKTKTVEETLVGEHGTYKVRYNISWNFITILEIKAPVK